MAEEKTAKIVHIVEDGGHYGFSYCSNCKKDPFMPGDGGAQMIPNTCPHCGIQFEGYEAPDFGGSDF